MGVGANPTACFVVVAFLLMLVRFWLDRNKEVSMKATKINRQVQAKSKLKSVLLAFAETSWALTTNFAVGLVTLSIL